MRRHTWLLAVLLALGSGIQAQSAKLLKANQYFDAGNYRKAIPLYEEVLGQADLPKAKARLAESFRLLGNYKASAQWYALVVGLPESTPEHKFYYGMMLLRTGDCKAAERWFKDYLKYHPYDPRKKRLLNACTYLKQLNKEQPGKITLSLPGFNGPNSEMGPVYYDDGLVFSVFRKSEADPSQAFLDLFKVTMEGQGAQRSYSTPQLFSGAIQSKFHDGLAAFNREETQIFFTRTRRIPPQSPLLNAEVNRLEIVTARRLPQGNWSGLSPLPFSSDDYSIAHPSISSDGQRLYFSSDMPGGVGGKDLYLAFLENGKWGPPINLGPTINTPDDEVFPFISNSGKLYFSSNGHLGLGGQDLFWAEEGYDGLWVIPHNLGAPFNTEADDFGIIFNPAETEGYFTSNRDGGKGKDDIYFFETALSGTPVQVDVVDLGTGDPVAYAKVLSSCSGDTLIADREGRLFLRLPDCCTLTGMADQYKSRSMEACERKGELAADTLFIALALAAKPVEAVADPEVGSERARQYILNGFVINRQSNKPVYQAVIKLESLNCIGSPPVLTNQQGRFSIPLEEDCCYRLRIERDNFFTQNLEVCAERGKFKQSIEAYMIPYANDPTSEGEGEGMPVKMDVVVDSDDFSFSRSAGDDGNSFAFRINVYYDTNRSSVQKESIPDLMSLLKLLQDNPGLILEISSHTDSKGNNDSNMILSQKRADVIVSYLVKSGIDKQRLVAKGYGESQLVNHCADGVTCTEEEHQKNRRTEFKVLGKVQ